MSTKLHHGYRLAVGTDPFTFIAAARTALDPVRDRADAGVLAERAVEIIDRAVVDGTGVPLRYGMPVGPLENALHELDEEQAKLKTTDWGHDPNRLKLSIGRDPETGLLAVLLFAEASLLVEAFWGLPEVEEYGYWNNTDQPDGVTDAEWDERRSFWDRVLPGYTPPAVAMLTWTLRGTYENGLAALPGDRSPLILEELPDPDQRARQITRRVVAAAACQDVTDTGQIMTLLSRSMNTTRFPEVVDAARALLVTDIDFAMLLGNRPPVIDDVEFKRAILRGLAAAAAIRLLQVAEVDT
jgi:hypothetical protein